MPNNVKKIVYNGETLIDLTSDTVSPENVLAGNTFHASNGSTQVGELVPVLSVNNTTPDSNGNVDITVDNLIVDNALSLEDNKITNLADGTSAKDAVNLSQLQQYLKISDLEDSTGESTNTSMTQKAISDELESLQSSLDNKVDKVSGSSMITEEEKTKLSGIQAGAEVNVQSDWNESNSSSDAFIKNKPTNVSQFVNNVGYLKQTDITTSIEPKLLEDSFVKDANYNHITVTASSVTDGTNTFTKYDDSELRASVNANTSNISTNTSAIATINRNITTLATNYSTLNSNLENEIELRDTQYASVTASIAQEVADRTAADNLLNNSISGETSARIAAVGSVSSRLSDEITNRTAADTRLEGLISAEATARGNADTSLSNRILSIENKIPAEASNTNQLADKNFVNNSIATASAVFQGTYNSVSELPQPSDTRIITINDYAFVKTESGQPPVVTYTRYKWTITNPTTGTYGWVEEYILNNSPFTNSQWDAINSGITDEKITAMNQGISVNTSGVSTNAANINSLGNRLTSLEATVSSQETAINSKADSSDVYTKSQIDSTVATLNNSISSKANSSSVYTKAQVDASLTLKANIADIYEKSDIDELISDLDASINNKQDVLTFDTTPTSGSNNPVTSGGIKTYVDSGISTFGGTVYTKSDVNDLLASKANSSDVYSKGEIATILSGYQETLTFDTIPAENSTNPVQSNGIYSSINSAVSINNIVVTSNEETPTITPVTATIDDNKLATIKLPKVALSGDYDDLINRPFVPTINNSTVVIQKNGATIGSFTLNSNDTQTVNIPIPTKTSDIVNDGSYGSSPTDRYALLSDIQSTTDFNDLVAQNTADGYIEKNLVKGSKNFDFDNIGSDVVITSDTYTANNVACTVGTISNSTSSYIAGSTVHYLANKYYYISCYLKADTANTTAIFKTGLGDSPVTLTTEWARYSVKKECTSDTSVVVYIQPGANSNATIYIAGLMVEIVDENTSSPSAYSADAYSVNNVSQGFNSRINTNKTNIATNASAIVANSASITAINTNIGDMATITPLATNVTSAINAVYAATTVNAASITTLNNNVGDKNNLVTQTKLNIVSAINEVANSVFAVTVNGVTIEFTTN